MGSHDHVAVGGGVEVCLQRGGTTVGDYRDDNNMSATVFHGNRVIEYAKIEPSVDGDIGTYNYCPVEWTTALPKGTDNSPLMLSYKAIQALSTYLLSTTLEKRRGPGGRRSATLGAPNFYFLPWLHGNL